MDVTQSGEIMDNSTLEVLCQREDHEYDAIYFSLMGTLVFSNGILLIAAIANWTVLRHNIVYSYLISYLISAIGYCLLSAFEMFHSDYQLVLDSEEEASYNGVSAVHSDLMHMWAFRKCLMFTMVLVIEFNIASLTYAISISTQFVGRYSDPKPIARIPPTSQKIKRKIFNMRRLMGKRCKAALLITLSWIIPLIITVPTAFEWSCVEYCQCLPEYRTNDTCRAPEGTDTVCARLWPPLTRSFIVVTSASHALAVLLMFSTLTIILKKFHKAHAPRSRKSKLTESRRKKIGEVNALGRRNSNGALKSIPKDIEEPPVHATLSKTRSAPLNRIISVRMSRSRRSADNIMKQNGTASMTTHSKVSRSRPLLPSSIKLLTAIAFTSLILISPIFFVSLYDIISVTAPPSVIFEISLSLTYLHVTLLPIFLIIFMSGLRKACVALLLKCPCMSKTEITIKRTRAETGASNNREVNSQTLDKKSMPVSEDKNSKCEVIGESAHGETLKGVDNHVFEDGWNGESMENKEKEQGSESLDEKTEDEQLSDLQEKNVTKETSELKETFN